MEDRVADLRARWTPEATKAAVAFLEQRPTGYDLPTMEHDGETYLDLRGLRVEETQIDKCYLRRAQFEKCDLVNSRFDSCDFSGAVIAESRVDFASFKNCEIRLDTTKFQKDATPRAMVRVCRNLKLNAMSMGNFADAGELTYLKMTYERLGYHRERLWGRWLASKLQDWLWGYGEKPWRLAVFMAFNIVLFGSLLHWVDPLPDKTWWEHVYFSGITYLTVGYGDLAPHAPLARLIAVVCAAAGIGTFGMLIASVTKKIMYR